ncbi:MAG: carbohydrate kinase, partial [Alistipes sp.]|nr:carbohydrate kinase [Candidatus Minthomonas equi]
MRKIIGVGETILDIIFKNEQPQRATPGGSVFNGLVTLGRLKNAYPSENDYEVNFVSDLGQDSVGNMICDFMEKNGITSRFVSRHPESKSAVSLAFLDDNNDADYTFYKDYTMHGLQGAFPEVSSDDLVIFASFYALNPVLRPGIKAFMEKVRNAGALIYYDINFRKNHSYQADYLHPTLIENYQYCDILRASKDDLEALYGESDPYILYNEILSQHAPVFIYTAGAGDIILQTPSLKTSFSVPRIKTVSTIGAGDNFNAGILYGLYRESIHKKEIPTMNESQWEHIIGYAMKFSAEVCQSYENYITV